MAKAERIIMRLSDYRLDATNEASLQRQVHELVSEICECRPEVRLNSRDRIDFLADSGVGIECKVKGSAASVVSQLLRYAESDQVNELILVTSKRLHLAMPPFQDGELLGKPLFGVWVHAF